MTNNVNGLIAGTVFCAVSVILMVSTTFEDKARAMTASFISPFAIGLIIYNYGTSNASWIKGGLIGLAPSLPDYLARVCLCFYRSLLLWIQILFLNIFGLKDEKRRKIVSIGNFLRRRYFKLYVPSRE